MTDVDYRTGEALGPEPSGLCLVCRAVLDKHERCPVHGSPHDQWQAMWEDRADRQLDQMREREDHYGQD